MRARPALAVAVFLTASAAIAVPRDFLLRKIILRAPSVHAPVVSVARRRATLPPKPSPCADAMLAPADVSSLVASDDSIFFTDYESGLLRVPKSGGTPVTVVAASSDVTFGPLVADATSIYYITADNETTGSIYSVPKTGGTPKQLATNLPAPIDLRVDATSVYWLNLGTLSNGGDDVAPDGSVERMLKDGSGRQKIVGNLSAPGAFDVDGDDIFVSETGLGTGNPAVGLRRVSKSTGTVTSLFDDQPVYAIDASGNDVFYSAITAAGDVAVSRIPKSGGTPQVLAPGVIALTILARDSRVWFMAFDSDLNTSIQSVKPDGTDLRIVKSVDLDSASIDVDDCAVYYASSLSLQRSPR